MNSLQNLTQKVERDLDNIIESLTTVESLEPVRGRLLKSLNVGSARLLVHPYIPNELRDIELHAIINATRDFAKTTGSEIVPLYKRTMQLFSDYIGRCDPAGTEYSGRFCRALAERLKDLTRRCFNATPFSRPAALTVGNSPKKYPLHAVGATVPVSVVIANSSDGFALDVRLRVRGVSNNLSCSTQSILIGGLEPGETRVEVPVTVTSADDTALLELAVEWKNFDDTQCEAQDFLEIEAQRKNIDWQAAGRSDPYSLSPVSTTDVLVGREAIIGDLQALVSSADIGSAFIRGQRRVGKTSIVKTLQTKLTELHPTDYIVVYLEAGDYIGSDAQSTIQRLGKQLCRAVCKADLRLKGLPYPQFTDALSPLTEFLQEATEIAPKIRVLFMLDEFDDLPMDLYKRGPLGDAFFRTIRSISNKPQFGFILVGSEKMEYVLSCQGDALNKFVKIPVDYFDKETHWNAFVDLIRKPATSCLEYSDSAVASLHEFSAGNPYFAKLICRTIYRVMIDRRDSHVTDVEVERAVQKTVFEAGSHSFQYFWQDGIIDPPPRAEEIAIRRAKVLLALTDCVREGQLCLSEAIAKRASGFFLDEQAVEPDLRSFERRKVLESKAGVYSCKVKLFQRWLVTQGYYQILTSIVDNEELAKVKQREELLRVKSDEILALLDKWDVYLGRRISEHQVEAWLSQFSSLEERRLAFTLLRAIRFYSTDLVRTKLAEAHGVVTRGTTWHRKQYESTKRRDILVTYLGGPGHSGAEYARRYGDENAIHPDNIASLEMVHELLAKRSDYKAVVAVDDFIGSGRTVAELLTIGGTALNAISDAVQGKLFMVVVCGMSEGSRLVQKVIEESGLKLQLHVLDTIETATGVFGTNSAVFRDEAERGRARDTAYKYGLELLSDWPLGYGNCEAAVVFDNKIPNNCLPILWVEKKGWRPLFRRL